MSRREQCDGAGSTAGREEPAPHEDPHLFFGSVSTGAWADPASVGNRIARALVRMATVALDHTTPSARRDALLAHLEAFPFGESPARATRYRPEDVPEGAKVRPNATGMHPLAGPANPAAPPVVMHRAGDQVKQREHHDLLVVRRPAPGGEAHHLQPGGELHGQLLQRNADVIAVVQGGFIAAGFDLMLGQAVSLAGRGGMTGGLTVRYVSPTPLYEPLRYEAWFDRVEGRKSFAAGRLLVAATERVCAEAEGVFIVPKATGPTVG